MTEIDKRPETVSDGHVELISQRDQAFANTTIDRLNSSDPDSPLRVIYGELGNGKTTLLDAIESGLSDERKITRIDWPSFEPYSQFISRLEPGQVVIVDDIDRLSWSTSEKVGFLELMRTNDQVIHAVVSSELVPDYKPKVTFGEDTEEPIAENVNLYDVVSFTDKEVSILIDKELGTQGEETKAFVANYQDVLTGFRRREWTVLLKAISDSKEVPTSIDDVLKLMDRHYSHHTMERVKAMSATSQKVLGHILFSTATSRATNVNNIAQGIGSTNPTVASEIGRQLKEKSPFITENSISTLYNDDEKPDQRYTAYSAQDPLFALWVSRRSFIDKQPHS